MVAGRSNRPEQSLCQYNELNHEQADNRGDQIELGMADGSHARSPFTLLCHAYGIEHTNI